MTETRATGGAAERAYDGLAPVYDVHLERDLWMRHVLWARYDACFGPGDRVLDLGCGTGTDMLHLAARGVGMTGIDVSPRMIDQARAKVEEAGLAANAELLVGDLGSIGALGQARFEGIISSFAGLNTLESMRALAADASRLLVPDGRMIVHLLNPRSLRAWLALLARGRWTDARSLGREGERVFLLDGNPVPHYLYRGETLYARDFAPHFRLERIYGLGVCVASPVNPPGSRSLPGALARLESHDAARRILRNWGRFVVLELRRRA
jgi:ubiquinone/menaquinone biosynthesis C-methylase UbiE